MKVSKIRKKLEQFLEVLEDLQDEQDIKLRSNTYKIAEDGDFFLGFSGYDGGYLTLSDIEEAEYEDGFAGIADFIEFLYYEELIGIIPDIDPDEAMAALNEIFYNQDVEVLYDDYFVSDFRKDNIQYLVKEIEELIID